MGSEQSGGSSADSGAELRKEHGWAIDIVRKHFLSGLGKICDSEFLNNRYSDFEEKHDPIYFDLLKGMQDEPLARTFVSYWTIAQTLAVESRFWLENAIAEIIMRQVWARTRSALHVYSQPMLVQGYLEQRKPVAEIGEEELEHLTGRTPWEVLIQKQALRRADLIVGQQERERVRRADQKTIRQWDDDKSPYIARDLRHLKQVAESLTGPPAQKVTLQCNLLVVEPDRLDGKVHAWAFRFVNPKTIASHPTRKQERLNVLRLYAYLVQEKIMRDPECIHVGVAALLPRQGHFECRDRYPDYFSTTTYWSTDRLWKFIGVPFEVVSLAVQEVAKEFRNNLIDGLRGLLPKAEGEPTSTHDGRRGWLDRFFNRQTRSI